ncbi:HNH endonuclease [Pseudobacteroides cellulosolvens]|uniref:Putative HNH nuclease YajD n=2 Tax=Eubacteriales TaxID=186802 RepID=A0A0L6JUF4_9FIRM|nr:HNH endonuclease signature motif containing protein [Pseudobacteroides cellulosolvens]KNY29057.1 HNH endonuclease [Pseudobacteroides cellulosolvens ATCC 35603 = DSM 2933]
MGLVRMPKKPPKPCAKQGCPRLTHERFCEEHQREEWQTYNRFYRDEFSKRFYSSRAWRKVRERKLMINPLCELCMKEERLAAATVVDHIIPIKDGGEVWDLENMQSLCKTCHERKGAMERFNRK